MQAKLLIFLMPFMGLALASEQNATNSYPAEVPTTTVSYESTSTVSYELSTTTEASNTSNYTCNECLDFFKQLKSSERIKGKLVSMCYSVMPRFLPFSREICSAFVETIFIRLNQVNASANCYAVGVCPAPEKPEVFQKWDQRDKCYNCSGVVGVAGKSLRGQMNVVNVLAWRQLVKYLSGEFKLDGEETPVAIRRYFEAFANYEMDAEHLLAYCYSISVCTQFPYHML